MSEHPANTVTTSTTIRLRGQRTADHALTSLESTSALRRQMDAICHMLPVAALGFDMQGIARLANRPALALLACAAGEVLGTHATDVLQRLAVDTWSDEPARAEVAALVDVLVRGTAIRAPDDVRATLRSRRGETRYLTLLTGTAQRDEIAHLLIIETAPPSTPPDGVTTAALSLDAASLKELVRGAVRRADARLTNVQTGVSLLQSAPRPLDASIEQHTLRYVAGQLQGAADTVSALGEIADLYSVDGARGAPLELSDLLMSVLAAWKTRAPQHSFELALPGEVPAVLADEQAAVRAINLLLEYSVRLLPAGGSVRVNVRPQADAVLVSLHQHQHSLPPARVADLFDPLRGEPAPDDTAPTREFDLALASAIVRAQRGRIWAEAPATGKGFTIYTSWPLVRTPARDVAPPPAGALVGAAIGAMEPHSPISAPQWSGALALNRAKLVALVIEENERMRRFLRANLEEQRYRALSASTVDEALRIIEREEPDVIILDGGLRHPDGSEPLPYLRAQSGAPIVVLARRADPLDCAAALDHGAADYLAKPLSLDELFARLRAAVRLHAAKLPAEPHETIYSCGDLRVDLTQRHVTLAGEPIALSKTEFKLLRALAQNAGMVLAHDVLLERVWGPAYSQEVEFVWVYIRRLRRKIEPDPKHPCFILTVPGVGYRLAARR